MNVVIPRFYWWLWTGIYPLGMTSTVSLFKSFKVSVGSYRNQSVDLQCKYFDWLLDNENIGLMD